MNINMAGLPNGDRFDPQTIPRPGLYSQHSNSVPSTPYQKPRDLRFHSRSPSPNRGIASQSPRSVVSEAVGTQTANRTQPVVCKYETGDEIRKRRIPYVDGGNEELGPPKKEPKKTLQPDEQEKLSGDMRELYDRLLPSEESEKRRTKLLEKLDRILNDKWPGNDIRVNVFGSSGNLLSSTDSDVDICITTTQEISMHTLSALLASHGMQKVVCRAAAKVPIVKCWDPELQLAADLNVNNTLALQNTRMIKVYIQLDKRVRPLAKIIKYWTKRRLLNDAAFGGTISSYTWICMIISFLQRRNPPILPSLQQMRDCRRKTETGEPSSFADDLDALRTKEFGKSNSESLGELLFQFFRHYGYEFEFGKYVVSVKEGRLLSRQEKGWDPKTNWQDKESRNRLCVEEPFTANRNLGNSADDYAWHGIHLEIRRAFDLLEDGLQLEKCCEQFEFPPEESRPIFQRPPPKPKPTLTRSVSQSNRTNHEPGSGRSGKRNNRNQSSQRSGNRRASSGASFANSRQPFSPQLGSNPGDYFNMKGNLHEQLYQQYQFLQAQQEHLRQQLAMHTQATAAQGRVGDLAGAGSPRPRQFVNGSLPSPRMTDHPPQTAPLLQSSYLYHYPQRGYPPPSPMSQARSRESTGTNTNPSSPSLVAAVPALRRNGHRASVPDGSASSVRSQSQPGRSLPPMLTMQQQLQAGYDIPGVLGAQMTNVRSASQAYQQGQGMPLQLSHFPGVHTNGHTLDGSLHQPKEYVGYYVGQSPQLVPQQYASSSQMPPPMALRDPPQRPRRVTPDLAPPLVNGRHSSRSPSPLGHMRSFSTTTGEVRTSQPTVTQSPTAYDHRGSIPTVGPTMPVIANGDVGGPVIVNGSNYNPQPKAAEKVNGVPGPSVQLDNEVMSPPPSEDLARVRPLTLPIRTDFDLPSERRSGDRKASDAVSPTSQPKADHRATLSPNGAIPHVNGSNPHYPESNPLTAPLLSPVAELRTPSPTQSRAFENASPEANGNLYKATKIAAAKQTANENVPPKPEIRPTHQRKGSAPMLSTPAPVPVQPKPASPQNAAPAKNEWQMAGSVRNKHKKSKSNVGPKPNGSGGQPMPANESERKGG
ncbi:Poly(A) RNA polymerase cid13 [Pseudocercospora fuligena]|uniref:polynucleotide adenylyltransferase n=1 Tax=Pseudocercospora fuligena TaxID=685502 RepID=A0A8H6RD55_9PEZI|nr:Poly(A) RNA polymerase cid13 [Pseudocercospora fuligena]